MLSPTSRLPNLERLIAQESYKVWRDGRGDPEEEGIEQLDSYLAGLGVNFGWLIIFNRRTKALPLVERLATQVKTTTQGRSVIIVRA